MGRVAYFGDYSVYEVSHGKRFGFGDDRPDGFDITGVLCVSVLDGTICGKPLQTSQKGY